MKRLLIIMCAIVALLATERAVAQSRTSYFMEGSYFRTELNPALAPTRGFVALPAMSGVGIDVPNNFLSVDNFFYKRDNQVVTALHGSVSADEFLGKLPDVGKLGVNANVNVLGVGFYAKRTFWNFGINLRSQSDIALSKDIFTILKTMGNGLYDLGNTSISSNNFAEVYLGSSFRVCKWINVGVRAKFLLGLANISTEFDQMGVNIGSESVTGSLRGLVRANAIFLDRGAIRPGEQFDNGFMRFDDIDFLLGNARSFGAAVDLGVEVRLLNNHLRISAAATDIGFIKWSAKTHAVADATADFYFNGINLDTGKVDADGGFDAVWGAIPNEGYTTRLNCSLNVGVEYNILRNRIAFGVLSHTEFCNSMYFTELTASVNFRPTNWLSATFSHTFLNGNKPGVFGFALNIHPRVINIFVGADYIGLDMVKYNNIPIPRYQKSINVYAGVGFNFGRPKAL